MFTYSTYFSAIFLKRIILQPTTSSIAVLKFYVVFYFTAKLLPIQDEFTSCESDSSMAKVLFFLKTEHNPAVL